MLSTARHLISKSRGAATLFALALTLWSAPAHAQTPVVFGDVIHDPGVYFLFGNQSGSGSDGIDIESDDVLLLLSRFTLRGDDTHFGIRCVGHNNVTIWGGRVTNFEIGCLLVGDEDCTVKDIRFDHSRNTGFFANGVVNCWFLRARSDHNGGHGFDLRGCEGTRVVSCLSHDNGRDGFFIAAVTVFAGVPMQTLGAKLRLCWAAYNKHDGIEVFGPTQDHEIVQNQCVNNDYAGIHLTSIGTPPPEDDLTLQGNGPHGILVDRNWCVFNRDGIAVDDQAHENRLTNNTALANFHRDAIDDNATPPCENLWFLNAVLTRGGAGAGCIF